MGWMVLEMRVPRQAAHMPRGVLDLADFSGASQEDTGCASGTTGVYLEYRSRITSSMSGSWIDRSATSYAAATAATTGAALASVGKESHWRGPSTRRVTAPATRIGATSSTRSTTRV